MSSKMAELPKDESWAISVFFYVIHNEGMYGGYWKREFPDSPPIQGNKMTELNPSNDDPLLDKKIELFCQSVAELLEKIHVRRGTVETFDYIFF